MRERLPVQPLPHTAALTIKPAPRSNR